MMPFIHTDLIEISWVDLNKGMVQWRKLVRQKGGLHSVTSGIMEKLAPPPHYFLLLGFAPLFFSFLSNFIEKKSFELLK